MSKLLHVSLFILTSLGCGKSSPQVVEEAVLVNSANDIGGLTIQEIKPASGVPFSLAVEQDKRVGIPRNIREYGSFLQDCDAYRADATSEPLDPKIGTMVSTSSSRILPTPGSRYWQETRRINRAVMQADEELRDGVDGITARLKDIYLYNKDGNIKFQVKILINGFDYRHYLPDPISGLNIYRLNKCIKKKLVELGAHDSNNDTKVEFHYYLPTELNFPGQLDWQKLFQKAEHASSSLNEADWNEVARSTNMIGIMMIDVFLPSEECRQYQTERAKADLIRYLSQREDWELLPRK